MSRPIATRVSSLVQGRSPGRTQWLCRSCLLALQTPPSQASTRSSFLRTSRPFTASATAPKKAGKRARDTASSDSSPPGPTGASNTATDDAYDFSELESSILKALERLTHRLAELRAGGRFNPSLLESLKVRVDKSTDATARLGDLAQVIPRGRTISVIVGEEERVKAVATAIQTSPHSLNPQGPTGDAPTTLTVQVPPPTGESRRAALDDAQRFGEDAGAGVKAARQAHHKKMRGLELGKKVRPDDLQRAHKQMEEVVKRGQDEVKRIVDGARKVLESA